MIAAERKRRAVILDRDGVINFAGKVDRVHELQLIPGAGDAIRTLKAAGWLVIVATNQGGLGEDMDGRVVWSEARLDRTHLADIHAEMIRRLGPGAEPDAIKFCPHAPGVNDDCHCHKPNPGMLLDAAREFNLDLRRCWMVGDRATDMQAGLAAGTRLINVLSGERDDSANCPPGTIVLPSIREAADWILRRR